MNILLTNDDGCDAPGLLAAYHALQQLGKVHVVAPAVEHSGCSHTLTLRRRINVHPRKHHVFGMIHAVDGTPADCVRLAMGELLEGPIDLVVAGVNRGANAGVDHFYSGTVAAAREGAFLGMRSMAISQAVRGDTRTDWEACSQCVARLVPVLLEDKLPAPGFWSVNLPSPVPADPNGQVRRVPIAVTGMPMNFERHEREGGELLEFTYGANYWDRPVQEATDFSTVREGKIAVSVVPLFLPFPDQR